MAAPKQDPIQVLEQMFNEVLIQAGKQLKATSKDGVRSAAASNAIRAKTSDALASYHYALDDLESEITRAKAVILRDLEKIRTARAPVPTPVPAPQPAAPPAPMMELPSSAAHTMSVPAFAPKQETKPVAPFPDMGMGMGMSNDVVDLTISEKKPSPRVPPGAFRPVTKVAPPGKADVRPSPKQPSKPAPKPPKVTPVPPPQIPRLQPPQPPAIGPTAAAQSQSAALSAQQSRPVQATPAAQATQDATLNAMLVPTNAAGGDINPAGAGNASGFTDMQFSVAPPNTEASGAPPAPMADFGLSTFAPQESGNDAMSLDNPKPGNANAGTAPAGNQNNAAASQQQKKGQDNNDTKFDDLFDLDNNNGGTDNMFDLGEGGVNDSTFDDMMYFNNDADMAQFDEAYFLQ